MHVLIWRGRKVIMPCVEGHDALITCRGFWRGIFALGLWPRAKITPKPAADDQSIMSSAQGMIP